MNFIINLVVRNLGEDEIIEEGDYYTDDIMENHKLPRNLKLTQIKKIDKQTPRKNFANYYRIVPEDKPTIPFEERRLDLEL